MGVEGAARAAGRCLLTLRTSSAAVEPNPPRRSAVLSPARDGRAGTPKSPPVSPLRCTHMRESQRAGQFPLRRHRLTPVRRRAARMVSHTSEVGTSGWKHPREPVRPSTASGATAAINRVLPRVQIDCSTACSNRERKEFTCCSIRMAPLRVSRPCSPWAAWLRRPAK